MVEGPVEGPELPAAAGCCELLLVVCQISGRTCIMSPATAPLTRKSPGSWLPPSGLDETCHNRVRHDAGEDLVWGLPVRHPAWMVPRRAERPGGWELALDEDVQVVVYA